MSFSNLLILLAAIIASNCYEVTAWNFNRFNNNANMKNLDSMKKRNMSINKAASIVLLSLIPTLPVYMAPNPAVAGLFTSAEQDLIDDISKFQRPVSDLLLQLTPTDVPNAVGVYQKTQVLKGGKEDSDVVMNYLEAYIQPLQDKMVKAAPKFVLDGPKQERLQILPSLMKGHILELRQAIASEKAPDQAREVEEVQETLTEFLTLLQTNPKYNVKVFEPIKPATDAELFGPFGCGFYGKGRVPGSNQCQ